MEYGMLDLVAEFIDIFRQYGCTEANDYQLRHGTRFVLSLYKKAGRSWIAHGKSDTSDYNNIHKPWTGISGVEPRMFEPVVPGSYGYAFQQAMAKAAKNEENKKRKKQQHKRDHSHDK